MLTAIASTLNVVFTASSNGAESTKSTLLTTKMLGIPRFSSSVFQSRISSMLSFITNMATSTRLSTFLVRSRRFSPNSPVSSKPAVSINTTGPTPCSSIDLKTGSVVVPAVADTKATSCKVKALISELLPTLVGPNIPIWRRSAWTVFMQST